MSSKGFPLNDLPTEILLCILEMLHRGDLCSMCLVSRSLDATTAPLLYNALEWSDRALEFGIYSTNPSRLMSRGFDEDDGLYKPCLAFKRRPFLRNYVRSLTLSSNGLHWGYRLSDVQIGYFCAELSLLPSLYTIRWSFQNLPPNTTLHKFSPFVKVMSKLRMLREVQLPCIQDAQIGYIDALNRSFETISIGTTAFNDVPSVQWLTRRRQNLQELNIFAHSRNKMEIYLPIDFPALERYSHHVVVDFPKFMSNLERMKLLRELQIRIDVHPISRWGAIGSKPIPLVHLRSLRIEIHQCRRGNPAYYNTAASSILDWYTSLATHSNSLEILHIRSTIPKAHPDIYADKLLVKIIKNHKDTLRSLRLDDQMSSAETLARLFARCTRLEDLGLKILSWPQSLIMFTFLQAMAVSLQRLYFVLPHVAQPPDVLEVKQLLSQAMPQLQEINIHAFGGFASVKTKPERISWESRWLFDEELGKPTRYIDVIPGVSERSNGYGCRICAYFR